MPKADLKSIIQSAPKKPGVYQYFDKEGTIIYVGKAKNLKNRVSSYFNNKHLDSGKTRVLVKKIADIKYIIVDTELDALLLENNLIKKYQPRYNVLLKDDKTFPWICIKNERFPRVFATRNKIKDGSEYFGPYPSVRMMYTVLELIKQLYPLRSCTLNLSPLNINNHKFKVCLEYHIGNCKGPCEGLQEEVDYNEMIKEVRGIIKGNISEINKQLKEIMHKYADALDFENAHKVKEKIAALETFQNKSTVVSPTINNVDVFSIQSDEKTGFVNYMRVVNGAIIQAHTVELKKKLDETDEELLAIGMLELRTRYESESKEIIVPFELDFSIPNSFFTIPQRGDKKKLLELSERNAKFYRLESKKQAERVDPERHSKRILEQLKTDLRLSELPQHIECFDNSNIQGSNPVGACVVFRNAKPAKKDYRHFNIKTVEGPDDFASMEEVVYRRYKRLIEEGESLPQLIVIDGGKGQLGAALKSLETLGLRGKIAIIGIAKRLEEIYFPGDSLPLYLKKSSESLKVIQQLRNEAHRFGITHHRNRRSKGAIQSELSEIKGIGEKTAKELLLRFKSVKRVKELQLKDLEEIIGFSKAKLVYEHFNKEG